MIDFNESFKEFTKFQADFLKPMREAGNLAADSFEDFARLSYATCGDMVDYTVEQTRLTAAAEDMTGLVGKQYEKAKEFGEKMTARYKESIELGKDFFSSMQKVEIAPLFEAPAKATAKAAKKAAPAASVE